MDLNPLNNRTVCAYQAKLSYCAVVSIVVSAIFYIIQRLIMQHFLAQAIPTSKNLVPRSRTANRDPNKSLLHYERASSKPTLSSKAIRHL